MKPYVDDVGALREAFSGFPCGVVSVAANVAKSSEVLIASSFTVGVSQDPPLVSLAVQHSSATWPVLRTAPRLGVSVLGAGLAGRIRQLSSKDRRHRFDGVTTLVRDSGAVLLEEAPIRMECSLWASYPAGDHDIVVLRIEEIAVDFGHAPLLWHRSAISVLETTASPAVKARA